MEWLEKAEIPSKARAQELGLEAWARLAQVVADEVGLENPGEFKV
jgi:hypothetical protein